MSSKVDAVVAGAGVSGLTTAVLLAEKGLRVRVIADQPPAKTLSVVAGAIWGPYMVTHDHSLDWSWETLVRLSALAERPRSGVQLVAGIEGARTQVSAPPWSHQLPGFRTCAADELPPGCVSGWVYSAPVVDMPTYLAYLLDTLRAAGGSLELGCITSLASLGSEAETVINCTGLGARELVPDRSLQAIRGELVVVDNPGIGSFFLEHEEEPPELTYFMPQGDVVILGGTAEDDEEDPTPRPGTAEAIVRRCAAVEPRLATARIREVRVGVRPARPTVRVERDGAGTIHNYGHGGSGLTLSWGCAQAVWDLLDRSSTPPVDATTVRG